MDVGARLKLNSAFNLMEFVVYFLSHTAFHLTEVAFLTKAVVDFQLMDVDVRFVIALGGRRWS